MRALFYILFILIGIMIPANGFGWTQEGAVSDRSDDSVYYEEILNECIFRYSDSDLSRSEYDCLCEILARHMAKWRKLVPTDKIPPLPDNAERSCLAH